MTTLRMLGRAALAFLVLATLGALMSIHAMRAPRAAGPDATGATVVAAPAGLPAGLVVTSLRAGGRAEAAGLRVGDVVERVDGHAPDSLAEVDRAVASGVDVDLVVLRDAAEVRMTMPKEGGPLVSEDTAGGGRYRHI